MPSATLSLPPGTPLGGAQGNATLSLPSAKPAPSEQEIRDGLNGHICRCGTYNRIVNAVQIAATRMNGGAPA